MLPAALRDAPVPELIRDGDPGSWKNRSRIVGRALHAMWPHVQDALMAKVVLAFWVQQEPNRSRSAHLSATRGVVEGRLADLAWGLDRLWPRFVEQRERRTVRSSRGGTLDEVELGQEDKEAVEDLTDLYARQQLVRPGRGEFFAEVFADVARLAKAAREIDGNKVVRAGRNFWCEPPHGRWRLQTKPTKKGRGIVPNPKYYGTVISFLREIGVLTPMPRARRQTQPYKIHWPPPDLGGRGRKKGNKS